MNEMVLDDNIGTGRENMKILLLFFLPVAIVTLISVTFAMLT